MKTEELLKELEIAAYEMAEAETSERRAHKLRLSATKRFSAAQQEIRIALTAAKESKNTDSKKSHPQ